MTKTPPVSKKGTSIEDFRRRVAAVEGRFTRIDHENTDYRQRLNNLMATLEDDQKQRRDDIKALEEKIEGVVTENEQLREILGELLSAAETFGESQLDEPLAELDARLRGQAGAKDRIGETRDAAADQGHRGVAEGQAKTKTEAQAGIADDKAVRTAEAPDGIEPDEIHVVAAGKAADAEILLDDLDVEAGPDAVELAANETSGEDVLELEAQVVDVEVETISPVKAKADDVAEPAPPPTSKSQPDMAPEKKPEAGVAADKKKAAVEKSKAAEITTDKETDQLDRILASIRRITSAL